MMMMQVLWFVCAALLVQHAHCSTCEAKDEVLGTRSKLVVHLMDKYEHSRASIVLPAVGMTVKFGVSLIEAQVDTNRQVLQANVWLTTSWTDSRLSWDPKDYEGISQIWIPSKLVWRPDITLYNSISPNVDINNDADVVVYSDGSVLWVPQARLESSCPMEAHPTDVQCTLTLGSWVYDGNTIDIDFFEENHKVNVDAFVPNRKFEITENEGVKHVKHYSCCKEPYPNIAFTLGFRMRE